QVEALPTAAALPWREEADEPCLLRVQREAVLPESLRKYFQHAPRVELAAEADEKVVGVAHEKGGSLQPRSDVALKPGVEHFVQVHVREQRRDDSPLRSAGIGMRDASLLHHSGVQPFSDESEQHSVSYPLTDDALQVPM